MDSKSPFPCSDEKASDQMLQVIPVCEIDSENKAVNDCHPDTDEAEEISVASRLLPQSILDNPNTDDYHDVSEVILIPSHSDRLACIHTGVIEPNDISNVGESHELLICAMYQQTLVAYMDSKGYTKVGQRNWDNMGNEIACSTLTWSLASGKTDTFITGGYQYFLPKAGNKDLLPVFTYCTMGSGWGSITFSSSVQSVANELAFDHREYTKKYNMLRGAKLKNVNVQNCYFQEVTNMGNSTWDKYYFPQEVISVYNSHIKNFLENYSTYSKYGIKRRGVLYYGPPGTGKTSIGKIACNELKDNSVIWVTIDILSENNNGMTAIKKMYVLADYLAPCLIILEDLDLFAEDRDGRTNNNALGTLMNVLDGVNSIDGAATIGTTNRHELIEHALSNRPGRFDRTQEVPTMDATCREHMLRDRLAAYSFSDETLTYMVECGEKWTGATMNEFLNTISIMLIEEGRTEVGGELSLKVVKKAIVNFSKGSPACQKPRQLGYAIDNRVSHNGKVAAE